MGLLRLDEGAALEVSAGRVLLGFWADWCVPSRALPRDVTAVAERFEDRLAVAAVDVERFPELRERYAVVGLPALVLLEAGRERLRRVGLMARPALLRLIEASLAP